MLEVSGLTKTYGSLLAVDDLSFKLEQGEFATLLGPSGCGKSTTLHAIAGLRDATDGTVYLRGEDVTDVPTNERNIGFVFQHSALFPHMTAHENITYGLKMQEFEGRDHDEQAERFLEMVELDGHGDHKPTELSGGQQRRLSLARALAYEPDILLLDEPLTGLDRVLRETMRNEIKKIQREVDVTTLHVTHDQAEALSMSDRVIVMNEGKKEQEGTPKELYRDPETEFVAEFVGKSTKFTGAPAQSSRGLEGDGQVMASDATPISVGDLQVHVDTSADFEDGQRSLYVRPEEITVLESPTAQSANSFSATITHIEYLGHRNEIEATLEDGTVVTAYGDASIDLEDGDEIGIEFDPADVIVL
ncbi:ABC transporter ATP-binding protein [Natronorubrum daqingense]|uniref:Molybdate/tungstate import ATP-binding protein WtpC n=1 Tax=Natronorubrum daqingense TaxID=588898 RepID=A0A1N7E542_9EURY|nr:ABC transporter ATP-binding protein [Natronorubrum daqingense]APX96369.1 Fe3+/spermidine/putrescine ABC transporter ATP-binding protein [Natronorubrum daqingense]SIR83252.1 putative spermidine/putrescine transport system ATP-binding protein/thiamine transport system ATP-binding protein/molybdate/tungstate transport system ATP-binding protein [Natronorubrum daqingense]